MFAGWLSFAGAEIVNAGRTMAYARALLPTLDLRDCYDSDTLSVALKDDPYDTPSADDAPWYDVDRPESAGFLGVYPLSMSGFTDSTRTATVGESTLDGGFVSNPRRSTREVRVSGLLIGTSDAAAELGLTWLKTALSGSECGGCSGDDLCFMASNPPVYEGMSPAMVDAATVPVLRHLRAVTTVEGPIVLKEYPLSCGGYAIQVEFTMVAAVAYVYGDPVLIARATGSTLQAVRPGSLIAPTDTMPVCVPKPPLKALVDPDCDPVPEAPRPPSIPGACGTEPASFFSYSVYIPRTSVESWIDQVVSLEITTAAKPARHVRVRMLPRPLAGQTVEDLNPCDACGSFVINYIPPNTKVTLDGSTERITYKTAAGAEQRGEHLVSGVGSEIFSWPLLTCGLGYYALIDVDTLTVVNLALSVTGRE